MKEVKKIDSGLNIYTQELSNVGELSDAEKQLFTEIKDEDQAVRVTFFFLLKNLNRIGLKSFFKNLLKPRLLKNKIIASHKEAMDKQKYEAFLDDTDVVFIHYLSYHNLSLIKKISPNIKLVLCFWGSDLLQSASEKEWLALKDALQKADAITVQNQGMRFVACAKYGWDLLPKFKVAPFIPNYDVLNLIDSISKKEAKQKLSSLFDIPQDKIWLNCGYRSIRMFQVEELITTIDALPPNMKGNILLVLTMNYGNKDKEYINRILQAAKKSKLEYIIIDRYLTDEELAALRKAMDIFIHFPMTDAMSATIIEHMYAGNLVITNSSLPYARFRKFNLSYSEVDEVDEVAKHVETGIMNQSFLKIDNRAKIHQMFEEDYNIKNWLEIIYDLKSV